MAGEDSVVVGEGEYAALEVVNQRGVVAPGKVGAADAEMEQGIAGDDSLLLRYDEAHAPGAMSGDIATFY